MSQFRPPAQTVSTGLVVAIVGFFSSFPIVLQGLISVGASDGQAASGLMAATLAMGLAGIGLSLWKKQPISVAWSTPGVALLAVTAPVEGGFAGAVAGFLIAGGLTMVAGLWRPLGRLATRIPAPLAQAMLAGVLISLCVAPFRAMAETPYTALPIVLTWFVVGRFNRLFAVPAAVVAAALVIGFSTDFHLPLPDSALIRPVPIAPEFSVAALLGIGLPLFIVTMATQNIPGIAILRSFGYSPPPGPLLTGVGGASVLTAPFGAPATCLAAITAAMCSNQDSYPDPRQRYWSAVMAGAFYCLFGLFAAVITGIAAIAPPLVLGTLAGVALIGIFANAAAAALEQPEYREAAAVTFLATASGMTVFGLSAAVWGLILGGIVLAVTRRLAAAKQSSAGGK
ncbi:MAG: benzoate/H(+) symporter BenE family transporter [Rhodospirillaceae bacterium]|nr:benzoate/H(+) symporter BenE family transporter [Rhodospirillaceae bacterium]